MQTSVAIRKKPDDATLLALHEAGKPSREIATILNGIHWTTVARRLKRLTPRTTTQIYKELRPDILAEKQRDLLMQTTKRLPARDQQCLAKAFREYYECERLERGQSTSNQAVRHSLSEEMVDLIGSITGANRSTIGNNEADPVK